MSSQALSAIHASWQPVQKAASGKPRLIVAGATGVLGAEVLRRLAGSNGFAHTQVLGKEPMATSLAQVSVLNVSGDLAAWHAAPAQVAVVMFEPPRLYYQRERALFTPEPEQLLSLAQWLRRCGVHTLVVVVPHAQGRLPDAVKRGLANLDEQALSALGFERLLLVRAAQKKPATTAPGFLHSVAAWMLSTLSYMVPASEQPVRPSKLAEFIDMALRQLPVGTHVASPELLWRSADSADTQRVVNAWLNSSTVQHPTG